MLQNTFQNIVIIGSIFTISILPLLIYLSKYKNKYNIKSIYNIFFIITIILLLPILNIKIKVNDFNKHEDLTTIQTETESNEYNIHEQEKNINNLQYINNIYDTNIEIKNNYIYKVFELLPYIWISLMAIIFLYNIIIYFIYIHKLKIVYKTDKEIENIIYKIKYDVDINKKIYYAFSSNISTPITIGFLKKQIILPINNIDYNDYKYILKHEIFHIKNRDIEFKYLLFILNCIYWFNPIIYILINESNEVIELNCDYNVFKNETSNYRIEYGKVLLKQIENNRNNKYKLLTNFASQRRNIMNRFSNIVTVQKKKTSFWISLILSIVIIIALLLMLFTPNVNIATTDTDENELNINKEIENTIVEEKTQEIENTTEEKDELIENKNLKQIVEDKNETEIVNNQIQQDTAKITTHENESVNDSIPVQEKNDEIKAENNEVKSVNSVENQSNISNNFIKPVEGTVGAKFYNNNHTGIDIVAEEGTPIKAAASGTVLFAGYKGSYGNLVLIRHANGTQTYYAHCSDTKVSTNQTVNQGDIVATVGSTGNSTGPHLHFEIRDSSNNPLNPQDFIY